MSATAPKHAIDTHVLDGETAGTTYATRGAKHKDRSHLRIVAPLRPSKAGLGIYSLFLAGVLALGLVGVLFINTSLASGAYTLNELQRQHATLAEQEQSLAEQVALVSAPSALEKKARELGMVPSETPVFLSLKDGSVLGKAKAATGKTPLQPLYTPADATVNEGADSGGAPVDANDGATRITNEEYDPAAADAAAKANKKNSDGAVVVEQGAPSDPMGGQ